jgi:hypothetical protein
VARLARDLDDADQRLGRFGAELKGELAFEAAANFLVAEDHAGDRRRDDQQRRRREQAVIGEAGAQLRRVVFEPTPSRASEDASQLSQGWHASIREAARRGGFMQNARGAGAVPRQRSPSESLSRR